MITIKDVKASWVLDSRGCPTVSCDVILEKGGILEKGSAMVPSGASTGTHEALELRDGLKAFQGKGVTLAVNNINTIIRESLVNKKFSSAAKIDGALLSLDTSKNKSELGANAVLGVSMAAHRGFANLLNLELWQYLRKLYFSFLPDQVKYPRLMANIINGGQHADNSLSIQEFMIVPKTNNLEKDVQLISEVYHTLKNNLKIKGLSTGLGDEGGFAPELSNTHQSLELIQDSIKSAGYSNVECELAMDAAASEFFIEEAKKYLIDSVEYTQSGLVDYYKALTEVFPIISIEDSHGEDDLLGWSVMDKVLGKKIQLVGDDLFVTNPDRFKKIGLEKGIANSILIKPNQVGSIIETAQVIITAKENDYTVIISHRSGETVDDFIADLAFACQSDYIKLGAPARGERVSKYNRLLEIKRSLEN